MLVCQRVKPPEIVDLPIENGDYPYKSWFSHGFPMVFQGATMKFRLHPSRSRFPNSDGGIDILDVHPSY
jgi:hypothetical protein